MQAEPPSNSTMSHTQKKMKDKLSLELLIYKRWHLSTKHAVKYTYCLFVFIVIYLCSFYLGVYIFYMLPLGVVNDDDKENMPSCNCWCLEWRNVAATDDVSAHHDWR